MLERGRKSRIPKSKKKRVEIDFLYLDQSTCTRCQGDGRITG